MRDRLLASRRPSLALMLAGLLFLPSCQSDLMSSFDFMEQDSGEERTGAADLPLGSWTRDTLHCAKGRCERWYEIDVEEAGMLRVDLYAPVGSGLPDCELSLETADGEAVQARVGRVQTQRRLRYQTKPNTYRLRIASKGTNKEMFEFEVVAEVRATEEEPRHSRPTKPARRDKPVAQKDPRPEVPVARLPEPARQTPDTGPEPEPEPEAPPEPELPLPLEPEAGPALPPEPASTWVVAEVLDVEETSGSPTAVMVEAGTPDGISPGMTGELYEGDTVIGQIEVVDVYPTGSRARIQGTLSAPISFDTLSRIEIPPEGRRESPEASQQ